ncbi:hypothetical protein EYF80_036997 [Liparis tanakae]|uniref:Uncharacterized protein n=1 Tax=Liparis tanakae TaxID=230148 RepID=A0A4Z2GIZ7_9TELE|nr:hypothetical protein EYF80_036997 [Liparis tanakae]
MSQDHRPLWQVNSQRREKNPQHGEREEGFVWEGVQEPGGTWLLCSREIPTVHPGVAPFPCASHIPTGGRGRYRPACACANKVTTCIGQSGCTCVPEGELSFEPTVTSRDAAWGGAERRPASGGIGGGGSGWLPSPHVRHPCQEDGEMRKKGGEGGQTRGRKEPEPTVSSVKQSGKKTHADMETMR